MKFSVIICTYNYARYLPSALQCLSNQTCKDFEVIVVDDGSTDDTASVLKTFRPLFSEFRVISKDHTGLPDSKNVGVAAARGLYVAFLDADDLWAPEYLESVKGILESEQRAELVCADGIRVGSLGQVIGRLFPAGLAPFSGHARSGREMLDFCIHALPSATVVKKSLFNRVGPFDIESPSGDDWGWSLRAAFASAYIVLSDRALVVYRQHSDTLSSSDVRMLQAWLRTYATVIRPIRNNPDLKVRARKLTRRWVFSVAKEATPRESRNILKGGIDALGRDPLLNVLRLGSYFGVGYAIRLLSRLKRLLLGRRSDTFAPTDTGEYAHLLNLIGAERGPAVAQSPITR